MGERVVEADQVWRGPVHGRTISLRIEARRSIGAWMAIPVDPYEKLPFVYLFDDWFDSAELEVSNGSKRKRGGNG